jgi:nucleotide-binding universal stress UspA family protein
MTAQNMHEASDRFDPVSRAVPQNLRVLLATDESDAARAGEEWVRRLRWSRLPAVDVLTVAPRPGWVWGLGLQTYRPAVKEAVIQAGQTKLLEAQHVANAVGSRLQEAGVRVRIWARDGEAADEIVRMARLEAADLVVVGNRGRSSRAVIWGRSVSSQVARDSDPAVLVAQPPPPGDDRLPRSIVVLAADDGATAEALGWLRDVGWLSETHLTLARLESRDGPPPSPTPRLWQVAGNTVSADSVVELPSVRERSIEIVRGLVERQDIDLAVVPRGRGRREIDLAMRIASAARVSVLLVPAARRSR